LDDGGGVKFKSENSKFKNGVGVGKVTISLNLERNNQLSLSNAVKLTKFNIMLLDRNKYTEPGYIGEELFSDPEKDRMHKCMVVEQTIADGDFSLDEALEAYVVSKEEYETYVAHKTNSNIFSSLSGSLRSSSVWTFSYASSMYFDVVIKMLNESLFGKESDKNISRRMQKVRDELNKISEEIEGTTEKA
jgi:hypothetical protein